MFDYTKWLIDETKKFIKNDLELSKHFPILEDTAENESNQSIFKAFTPSEIIPCIICKVLENRANKYTFTQEAETLFSIEIGINSDLQIFEDKLYTPMQSCEYIANKLANFYENVLDLRRLTIIHPMPITEDNSVYVLYLRYTGKHDLLNNRISK